MNVPQRNRARDPWAPDRRDVEWRPETPSWFRFALCRQMDPDLWFQDRQGDSGEAKKACGMCTVRSLCLEWALDQTDDEHGIIAGTSPKTRHKLRQQRAEVAA